MDISIFAKHRSFAREDRHLRRGSSVIRGEQVVDYLGAKLNPEDGYESDICIYVKPQIRNLYSGSIKFTEHSYIDIIDAEDIVHFASKNPDISIIVCSKADYDNLSKLKNRVVYIPQHHCNFERIKRDRNRVTVVGMIGAPRIFNDLPKDFKERLNAKGLEFLDYSMFRQRQDVVDFYKKIDIQVVWRPKKRRLSNPLKIVNAASFGIPTVALQEDGFQEMDGYYIPVENMDELIVQLEVLKSSPELYTDYAEKCFNKAEEYHISNIAKLYRKL